MNHAASGAATGLMGPEPKSNPQTDARIAGSFIENAQKKWIDRKYRIRIIDEKCGAETHTALFKIFKAEPGEYYHANVDLLSASPDSKVLEPPPFDKLTIGRSYVTSIPAGGPANFCKQNIQDDVLAHEYAHIIGLVDEYHDDGLNMAGCVYEMPDGKNIEALPNADTVVRGEKVVGGRFNNEKEILNSVARRGAMPRHPRYCLQ